MGVVQIDPYKNNGDAVGDPAEGWMYVWNGGDDPLLDTLNDLADRLAKIGITIELTGDDDYGTIRLMRNGQPML